VLVTGGFGADQSVNISNEFGGQIDPQLFGKLHFLSVTV